MRKALLALVLVLSTGPVLSNSTAQAVDIVNIDVQLNPITFGNYRLTGQSAFIQTRTSSSTSGGQLDGVDTSTTISFQEIFPPPSKADYQDFAYFGIVEILNISGDVIDTSVVIAHQAGLGVGSTVDSFGWTEAQLVAGFTGGFDSPEFLDMLDLVPANPTYLGTIAVPSIGRAGTTLDLIGYINGELGVKIGELSVTVVPEPSTLAMFALGAIALFAWRRRK